MSWLDQFECLDVIGNGSFGIIRKVRRKTDGVIFARKDLNFERMSERDRKQIVAEVNILKDLHHTHIVRYHDRYVDRDAGILYILMEYCGGGDLSTIIKQATKLNRPIPEDTIWNYFMQILLALVYCHHPNGHARRESAGTAEDLTQISSSHNRRPQILHRDLKPDNVFLSDAGEVKLGDFGLSKALSAAGPASFASTYVGTPYYMSPELMQEKAYDSKSDIWSLGCLIYELCALKPPFHEAKTHAELSVFIRNGRIPPLPRGYSENLTRVIKAMLNLNPAMRPSAIQLLQHERLELAQKVTETSKMIAEVRLHKQNVSAREKEVHARELALLDRESRLQAILAEKDAEIANLRTHGLGASEAQVQARVAIAVQEVTMEAEVRIQQLRQEVANLNVAAESRIREAVARREEELRLLVLKHEEGVKVAMQRREDELMEAVRKREEQVNQAWIDRERDLQEEWLAKWKHAEGEWEKERAGFDKRWEDGVNELKERVAELEAREREVDEEWERLFVMRRELKEKMKGKKDKNPLEEVINVLPSSRKSEDAGETSDTESSRPRERDTPRKLVEGLETPVPKDLTHRHHVFGAMLEPPASAMKGVVLTATGEPIATPAPAEFAKIFDKSPKVDLKFGQIFNFDEHETDVETEKEEEEEQTRTTRIRQVTESPSKRASERAKQSVRRADSGPTSPAKPPASRTRRAPSASTSSTEEKKSTPSTSKAATRTAVPTARLRRPSTTRRTATVPASQALFGDAASKQPSTSAASSSSSAATLVPPRPAAGNLPRSKSASSLPLGPPPSYDLNDEDNLPSPFLKKIDRDRISMSNTAPTTKATAPSAVNGATRRRSDVNRLRSVAAANIVKADRDRSSVASARKAAEDGRKALLRT
ncbi:kinase-like protein [Punctularia strigosozonata HHB-11173 SS5]|uniref:kinase-like protein n=1 Tax=Punctularia strigosozonata (strain HHB-11173) TaxID=741275 RepID=UPI0004417A49|nr:kinase-like protein [Punctularia strigosozonata HHB-11173 SS5]EIN11156.1 kinase-like protein [Punctularia strigosozonata HHB-11173 SS5]